VWEIFHAFLLAHDDIIDNGEMRRARPTLHRQLASLDAGSAVFGVNLAIVGGDLLFSGALRLLHDLELPPPAYREVLRLFSRVACQTGFGQAIDICQSHERLDDVCERTLLRGYHLKTAAYTFEGPMLAGAVVAGVAPAAREALSRYALALGQAYQLHNDLIDLATPASAGCDLVQGKRTVTLLRARGALPAEARGAFDARLARAATGGPAGIAEAESLRLQLRDGAAAGDTRRLIADLVSEAETATTDAALPRPLGAAMGELLRTLGREHFATA
jgi:geranylgeranyl pyrophosphate synthase